MHKKKRKTKRTKDYEVYIVRLGDEVVYVGEGKKGRHKHVLSGKSNAYGLNELHFKGVPLDIEVKTYTTKRKVQQLEHNYILEYLPKFNTIGKPRMRSFEDYIKAFNMLTTKSVPMFEDLAYILTTTQSIGNRFYLISDTDYPELYNNLLAKQIGNSFNRVPYDFAEEVLQYSDGVLSVKFIIYLHTNPSGYCSGIEFTDSCRRFYKTVPELQEKAICSYD